MTLEIDLGSLKRFWDLRAGVLRFVVAAELDDEPSLERLEDVADDLAYRVRTAHEGEVRVDQWIETPRGWSATMHGAHTIDAGMAWLERFADLYRDGKIIGGPRDQDYPHDASPALTAFVAYGIPDLTTRPVEGRSTWWHVPEHLTAHLASEAVNWSYSRGSRYYLTRSQWSVEASGQGLETALAQAVAHRPSCYLGCARSEPYRSRTAFYSPQGRTAYQVADVEVSWRERVEVARRALLFNPRHTDVAFVKYARGGYTDWADSINPPPETFLDEVDRPLLTSFVPDAWGLMLLTRAHLDRARDLSRWNITHLLGDRYLLEAPDLEPWYTDIHPDPDIHAQARRDLEGMILTVDLLEAHNPWPTGDRYHKKVTNLATYYRRLHGPTPSS